MLEKICLFFCLFKSPSKCPRMPKSALKWVCTSNLKRVTQDFAAELLTSNYNFLNHSFKQLAYRTFQSLSEHLCRFVHSALLLLAESELLPHSLNKKKLYIYVDHLRFFFPFLLYLRKEQCVLFCFLR